MVIYPWSTFFDNSHGWLDRLGNLDLSENWKQFTFITIQYYAIFCSERVHFKLVLRSQLRPRMRTTRFYNQHSHTRTKVVEKWQFPTKPQNKSVALALHLPLQEMIFNKNKIECFLLYLFFSCLLYQKAAPAPCCKKSLDKFLKILTKQQLIPLQILSNLRPGNTTLLTGNQKPTP